MANYHQPKLKLTYERARELFDYNSVTGKITCRVDRGRMKAGDSLRPFKNGYVRTYIDGELVYGHHLAWLLHYEVLPKQMLDHRDLNRSNNAIDNLRYTNTVLNGLNRRPKPGHYRGVWKRSRNTWNAYSGKPDGRKPQTYYCPLHAALVRDDFILKNFERGAVALNFEDDNERALKGFLVLLGYGEEIVWKRGGSDKFSGTRKLQEGGEVVAG